MKGVDGDQHGQSKEKNAEEKLREQKGRRNCPRGSLQKQKDRLAETRREVGRS